MSRAHFIKCFCLSALISIMPCAGVQATTGSGIDTQGQTDLPFAINGAEVMDMKANGLTINGLTSSTTPSDTLLMVGPIGAGMPPYWGGIHSVDVYANGSVGTGTGGGLMAYMNIPPARQELAIKGDDRGVKLSVRRSTQSLGRVDI